MPKKATHDIGGLFPIQPPDKSKKMPGVLTLADLEALPEVRFIDKVLEPEDFNTVLLGIQAWCQNLTNWGLNDKLVGLQDFDIAVITDKHDPSNTGFVSAGAMLVAKHTKTGKYAPFALNPPKGVSQDSFNKNTAIALVALSEPDPPPTEE